MELKRAPYTVPSPLSNELITMSRLLLNPYGGGESSNGGDKQRKFYSREGYDNLPQMIQSHDFNPMEMHFERNQAHQQSMDNMNQHYRPELVRELSSIPLSVSSHDMNPETMHGEQCYAQQRGMDEMSSSVAHVIRNKRQSDLANRSHQSRCSIENMGRFSDFKPIHVRDDAMEVENEQLETYRRDPYYRRDEIGSLPYNIAPDP